MSLLDRAIDRDRAGPLPLPLHIHDSNPQRAYRSHAHTVRCFLSTPFKVLTCILVTIFFFYLIWHPLMNSRRGGIQLVHAAEIPPAVLVDHAADMAEVSQWADQTHHQKRMEHIDDPSLQHLAQPPFTCYGVHAQRGRRRYMEDTHAVYVNHELHYSSTSEAHLMSVDTEEGEEQIISPWALFGVFDGHGGKRASEYVASYLLPSLHSTLVHNGHIGTTAFNLSMLHTSTPPKNISECFEQVFREIDEEFIEHVAKPASGTDGSTALVAGIYYKGETPVNQPEQDPFELVVASIGDCRAILIHPSHPHSHALSSEEKVAAFPMLPLPESSFTPLSVDHKPHLPSERLYIESLPNGFVTTRGGTSRVQGILAVSRAIGDMALKPFVRNTPDVLRMQLIEKPSHQLLPSDAEPQCQSNVDGQLPSASSDTLQSLCGATSAQALASDILLMASDGFWDEFSSEEAAAAVHHFLMVHSMRPVSPNAPPLFSSLASHLAKQAYLRGAMDNITVMAVHIECIQKWIRENVLSARTRKASEDGTPV